ncbi:MAG: T9SS type A sorting domain-containing protein [Flavitalea sp.]
MLRILNRFACFFALSIVFLKASAQGDCVDIDKARYPINIGNVETSPGHFGTVSFAWNNIWNFTNIIQTKRTVNIGSNGLFVGLLEYKPPSYTLPANANKDYPVIIYFHGGGSKGNGSAQQLCRLFKDLGNDLNTHLSIPGRVERNTALFTQVSGVDTYEYLVISPQFNEYTRLVENTPDRFPTADDVEDVIDYVVSHYRIDERRIYLTGFSNGANMIVEYAASSVARAKRVAAIMPVSLCSELGHPNNTSRGFFAKNIGLAKLKTWFVYCESDACGDNIPNAWIDSIRKVPGFYPPRYTRLQNINPPSLYNCSDTLTHDAWSRAYDPNFKVSYTFTKSTLPGALVNDGINKNMYTWFTEQISAVLPVKLKSYTTRLLNDQVQIDWVTSDEKDNSFFTIERAGTDQSFKTIATIPGSKSSHGDKAYTFTDKSPLDGLSFYRLVQTDIDGEKDYFEIKKIINQKDLKSLIVSPNPFTSQISAFITLNRTQKVRATLTDISGKELMAVSGVYNKGLNEIRMPAQHFEKGIYLLKVTGDNVSVSQKVIKR